MSYPNDPFDPFDNGKQWQNIQSSSTWSNAAGASSNVVDTAGGNPPATTTATLGSASASNSMQTGHFNYSSSSSTIPSIPPAPTAALVQPTAPNLDGLSSSSTSAAKPTAMISEDMPPPYEATVINVRQIHDNYDHLRGPPGQRGADIKTRIPLDSTPSSHYTGGDGASGSGSGTGISSRSMPPPSSSPSGISPSQGQGYGAIPQVGHPSVASSVPQHHQVNTLHGQASHGRDDDELHSRDVDRLLGTQPDVLRPRAEGHDYDEEPDTHWGIVGNGKAWMGFVYLLFVLFPDGEHDHPPNRILLNGRRGNILEGACASRLDFVAIFGTLVGQRQVFAQHG
ncbi:hypothetical protein BGZ98_009025 [Dissophora globulifera]|nr:hypothetical protein BGZ98_009025 [Dissophora globulifera]